jgi:hypothetical protein
MFMDMAMLVESQVSSNQPFSICLLNCVNAVYLIQSILKKNVKLIQLLSVAVDEELHIKAPD